MADDEMMTDADRIADRSQRVVARVRRAYARGITRPLAWRRAQLDAMIRMLRDNKDAIIRAMSRDLGKPAAETALMEIGLVAGEARYVRARLPMWCARHYRPIHYLLQPALGWTIAEPKGVVLIISPWNYPLLLSLEPMVDAIAAGNAICLKPSEISPNISNLIERLIGRYLDTSAIQVVQGGPADTTALLAERFDHIFYTGGGRVGSIVMKAAAEHLTPVTLELGGKSPCFVDGSVDLRVAARRIAWGKFTNAGQTCVAPDYVLVTPDAAERLTDELGRAIHGFYGDDPRKSGGYGRIVSARHFERVMKLMPDPSDPATGTVVFGGESDRAERYIAPTVLTGVDPSAPVMREEIFGPILPVLQVADADAAVAFIDGRPRPLAAYVFSNRRRVRAMFERGTSSGALGYGIPLGHLLSSRLPFGGVGRSGIGAYHGRRGFLEFSHVKTVLSKPQFPDTLRLVYPPYTAFKRRLIDAIR